jgi:hypothetical protein
LVKKKKRVDARDSLFATSRAEEYGVAILISGAIEVVGICLAGSGHMPHGPCTTKARCLAENKVTIRTIV